MKCKLIEFSFFLFKFQLCVGQKHVNAMGDFYATGIEICAGFGPVGITEIKPFGPIVINF